MKLLEIKDEDALFDMPDINYYDAVFVRHKQLSDKYEGKKLHIKVSSESPSLGILKSIEKYLNEILGLAGPITDIDMYADIYRVYGETTPMEGFMGHGRDNAGYVLEIGNCNFCRLVMPEMPKDLIKEGNEMLKVSEIASEEAKKYKDSSMGFYTDLGESDRIYTIYVMQNGKIVFERKIKSSELKSYKIKKTVEKTRDIFITGPIVSISGEDNIVNGLIGYLKDIPLEKVKTYDEYQIAEEDETRLKSERDKNNAEYIESRMKADLIAKELGWSEGLDFTC